MMAVHKLVFDDFDDVDYSLFALHCAIEDYRLAFHINNTFKTNLKRTKEDLDFKDSKASFSLFEWENTNLKTTWNLIIENNSTDKIGLSYLCARRAGSL